MKIFNVMLDLLVKTIKLILFISILLLLSPVIVLNYFFILYIVIFSPPNYEQQGVKGQAFYEALKMSIGWIILFYKQFMNKKISHNKIIESKLEKILTNSIIYIIGSVLFLGAILNMCISGYFILNRESIMQKNVELKYEIESIKSDFKAYGNSYNSKNILFDEYDKINKVEEFIFEYRTNEEKIEDCCVKIMGKNKYQFVDKFYKDKKTTLLFKKNDYISRIYFKENDEMKVSLRRNDFYRESKFYNILRPIIFITSPMNPLEYFE